MIDAPSGISGSAFCAVNSTPLTLTLKIESYSSSVMFPRAAYLAMPAFAKRISSLPFSSLIRAKRWSRSPASPHAPRSAARTPANSLDGASEFPFATTGDVNVCALFCQGGRRGQADSASAACYQCYLSVKFRHSVTSSEVGSSRRLFQKGFDLLVKIPGDRERVGIPVWSQKTNHPVIGQMHAVGTFVDEHGDRSIRAGVRNMLRHFLHDERIANDKADHPGLIAARCFTHDGAMIKLHKRHQPGST